MISIVLNGTPYKLESKLSLLELITHLDIAHKAMAVAVNTQVVKKSLWAEYRLQEGDEVEILDFVGGG